MRVTLSPTERRIVEVTLAYANTRRKDLILPSELHQTLTPPRTLLQLYPGLKRSVLLRTRLAQSYAPVESIRLSVQREVQTELRQWLGKIDREGLAAFSEIAPRVESQLRTQLSGKDRRAHPGHFYNVGGVVLLPRLRDRKITYDVAAESTAALLAYGTALILDKDRGLAHRLGQCGWCGRFNLAFEGRPRTYCNTRHRLRYDRKMSPARVKAWRERKRRKETAVA